MNNQNARAALSALLPALAEFAPAMEAGDSLSASGAALSLPFPSAPVREVRLSRRPIHASRPGFLVYVAEVVAADGAVAFHSILTDNLAAKAVRSGSF